MDVTQIKFWVGDNRDKANAKHPHGFALTVEELIQLVGHPVDMALTMIAVYQNAVAVEATDGLWILYFDNGESEEYLTMYSRRYDSEQAHEEDDFHRGKYCYSITIEEGIAVVDTIGVLL